MKQSPAVAVLALCVAWSGVIGQSDTNDPGAALKPGKYGDSGQILVKAAEIGHNMQLVGHQDKPNPFNGYGGPRGLNFAESDLAFRGHYVYQGNFAGFTIWDMSNPASPKV